MRRVRREKTRAAKYIALLILVFALPALVRAAGQRSNAGVHVLAVPTAQPETGGPQDARSTPVSDDEAQVTPTPETGYDSTAGSDAVETIEPRPIPQAGPPQGVWTYENSKIQVTITRESRGAFVFFAADVQLTSPLQFSCAFSNERYGARAESLSDIAARHMPLIAVNGDYYGFHENGIIIRGGELYRNKKTSRQMLIVEANGDLSVVTERPKDQSGMADALMARGVLHTFEFGPVLVENGEAIKMSSAIMPVEKGYLEPRTAIGQLGPLHYLVIVVDGRSEGYSAGCDLPALQQIFMDYGVHTAFNLDGGGSTTLWFDGQVINRPSSGDERKVSDIVMFLVN